MRKPPLLLTLLLVVAFGLWGGYWFIGATATEKGLQSWLEARRADGWVAEAASVETHGFPNRFDTTFEDLNLADPGTGVSFSAPVFQTLSLSYKPLQVIAVIGGEAVFASPDARYAIRAETFHASSQIGAAVTLPIRNSVIELVDAQVTSSAGWTAALGRAQVAMRESPGATRPHSYDLSVQATNIDPGEEFRAATRAADGLPDLISDLDIEATVAYSEPWDRFAIERARPQPRHVVLDRVSAHWGPLALTASGTLEVGASGSPTGGLDVEATNWRDMIALARATGAISEDWAGPITRALDFLAARSGDPETLEAKLTFSGGLAYLGPIPIGTAPDLRLP